MTEDETKKYFFITVNAALETRHESKRHSDGYPVGEIWEPFCSRGQIYNLVVFLHAFVCILLHVQPFSPCFLWVCSRCYLVRSSGRRTTLGRTDLKGSF